MTQYTVGPFEEERKNKLTRSFVFLALGTLSFFFYGFWPVSLIIGMLLVFCGAAMLPSPEEEALAKQEKQKRLAEQISFFDQARAIRRQFELDQFAQSLAPPVQGPVEDPEIARIRREYELDNLRRRERAKQLSSNIETLAEKISTTKQFELDALKMVQQLKDAGTLSVEEEAMLKEIIKDKVLQEFHVDRRDGRTRH
jgi:hypothetical protein